MCVCMCVCMLGIEQGACFRNRVRGVCVYVLGMGQIVCYS